MKVVAPEAADDIEAATAALRAGFEDNSPRLQLPRPEAREP